MSGIKWLAVTAAFSGAAILAVTGVILLGRWYLARLVDHRIGAFQNDLIDKHMNEVENMYRQMRGWRHDFHNHIQTMQAFLEMGQTDRLADYLNGLNQDLEGVEQVLKTGNVMADAILNSKLSLAKTKNIAVSAKARVPARMPVSDVNFCAVVGNLLDNAMESCMRIEEAENRFIRIYIGTMKRQLYISVTNSAGEIKKESGRYLSSKKGRDEGARYGFGLMRVDRVVRENGGYVNRQSEEGVFATEVMLPLEE